MKKILLATTAVIATAGMAAADVSPLSGSARMGLVHNDAAGNVEDTRLHTRVRIVIQAAGETDGGLGWGARTRIEATNGSGPATEIDSSRVWISGAWGKLTFGDTDPAGDDFGLAGLGFTNINIDKAGEASDFSGSANVRYDGSFGPLTIVATTGLSYAHDTAASNDWSIGFAYDFGDFNVAMAYDHDDAHDAEGTFLAGENQAIEFRVAGTFAGITTGLYVAENDTHGQGFGIDLAYKMGDLTLLAVYSETDNDHGIIQVAGTPNNASRDAFGVGFKFGLGGGATLAGGIGEHMSGDTVADLGINLRF